MTHCPCPRTTLASLSPAPSPLPASPARVLGLAPFLKASSRRHPCLSPTVPWAVSQGWPGLCPGLPAAAEPPSPACPTPHQCPKAAPKAPGSPTLPAYGHRPTHSPCRPQPAERKGPRSGGLVSPCEEPEPPRSLSPRPSPAAPRPPPPRPLTSPRCPQEPISGIIPWPLPQPHGLAVPPELP